MTESLEDIFKYAEKAYFRGGNFLKNLLSKPEKYLTGEEALSIYNIYAMPPRELKILLKSHGFDMDEDKFIQLLKEQQQETRNTIQPVIRR